MTEPSVVHQEPDRVPGRRLLALAGLVLLVSAAGVGGACSLMQASAAAHSVRRPVSSAAFQAGTPERTPIATAARGLALQAEERRQLCQYGWVDRDAGIARIPIERAMDLRAGEAP